MKVAIDKVVVGERFRTDFKNIEELAKSIERLGLIHPIVVDSEYNLCAGGRRLAAVSMLGWMEVDATFLSELSLLERREIELEENLQRENLSWQEEVALKKEIDKLKKEMYGDVGRGDPRATSWSTRKTADLLGEVPSNTSMDIQLAEAMELIPELKECKTKDEARRKLKSAIENMAIQELLKRDKSVVPTEEAEVIRRAKSAYIVGDAYKGLIELRGPYPLVMAEVDPPYGIDLHNVKKDVTVGDAYQEVDAVDVAAFTLKFALEIYRVLATDAWIVWWHGSSHAHDVLRSLRLAGFDVDEIPCIWCKDQGQTNHPDRYLARAFEPFFVGRKGNPVMHKRGRLNWFHFPTVPAQHKIHPTERPIALIEEVISTLCIPSGTVLVPFLGSGNTIRAAFRLGMNAFGWDIKGTETKTRFIGRILDDYKVAKGGCDD